MNIAIICDLLGNKNNGLSVVIHNLKDYLQSRGHNVCVICPDEDKTNKKGYYVVPHIHFKLFKFLNRFFKNNDVIMAKYDKKISNIIENYDCVYITTPFILGCKIAQICKKKNIPVIFSLHMMPEAILVHLPFLNYKLVVNLIYKYWNKKIFSKVDALHFLTQEMCIFIKTHVNKKIKNTYVIPNGISDQFYIKKNITRECFFKNKILILNIGRYSPEKKQEILIKAIKYSKYKNKIQLVFLGKGPLEKKLKKISFKEQLVNYPIFNCVNHEKIVDIINICDLYVHTSISEAGSVACLEAVAGGLIPIFSNSIGCHSRNLALHENNLFQEKNCKDLAKKIDFWIENKDLQKEYKLKYIEFMKKFKLQNCMQQMEQMFIDVVKKKKKKIL